MGGGESAVVATQCADPELGDDSESAAQVPCILMSIGGNIQYVSAQLA